jgi:hypothetical protein
MAKWELDMIFGYQNETTQENSLLQEHP